MVDLLLVAAALLLAGTALAPRHARPLRIATAACWLGGVAALAMGAGYLADVALATMLAGAAALAVVVLAGMRLTPTLLVALVVLALSVRLPLPVAGETLRLLVPLYVVLVVVALLDATGRWPRPHATPHGLLVVLADAAILLGAAAACASVLWSHDPDASRGQLLLTVLPFVLLYQWLRRWWAACPTRHLWIVAGAGIAAGVALATVGIVQHATETLFWNSKVITANAVSPTFRVNGWMWDPNIYGRYLVLAILLTAVAVIAVRTRSAAWLAGGAATLGVLGLGLLYSWSLSSFLGLACGALVLLVLLRSRLQALVALLVLAGLVAVLVTPVGPVQVSDPGRTRLAVEGVRIAADNPVLGVGFGAFETAYAEHRIAAGRAPGSLRSPHNELVSVAAELGLGGLLLHMAAGLLALGCAGVAARSARDRHAARGRSRHEWALPLPTGWWAAGGIAAITAHGMFYAGVTEDPATWLVLAAAVGSADRLRARGVGWAAMRPGAQVQ